MARKVKGPDEVEPQDEGERATDGRSFVGMTKSKLKSLLARLRTKQAEMDESRGEMGSMVLGAVDKAHCHKGALAWVRRLDKMDPVKRDEWLFHFQLYCRHLDYMTSDLFRDATVEAEGASNVHRLQQAAE